jgi:hypothetical protein
VGLGNELSLNPGQNSRHETDLPLNVNLGAAFIDTILFSKYNEKNQLRRNRRKNE